MQQLRMNNQCDEKMSTIFVDEQESAECWNEVPSSNQPTNDLICKTNNPRENNNNNINNNPDAKIDFPCDFYQLCRVVNDLNSGFLSMKEKFDSVVDSLENVTTTYYRIHDKVVLLEASVRVLENNVIAASNVSEDDLFHHHWNDQSSPISSFSSVLSMAASAAPSSRNERTLPRRHHTIGSIRYDSAAYKTVSFQDAEPIQGGAGVFRHIKNRPEPDTEKSPEPPISEIGNRWFDEDKSEEQTEPTVTRRPSVAAQNDEQEDTLTSLTDFGPISPSASSHMPRSKSFNDVATFPRTIMDEISTPWMTQATDSKRQSPTLRSKSFKEGTKKSNRFSWDADSGTLSSGSLRDFPSHLRSSLASLSSLDLPSLTSSVSLDISARDLSGRKSSLCGSLELKRNSGFKTFKKYWCAVDGQNLYIFGRDKDPKAKQAVHLAGYTVNALPEEKSTSGLGSSFRGEASKKKGRQFELIPPTGAKDTRLFVASTKEECAAWVAKLAEAIKSAADAVSALQANPSANPVNPNVSVQEAESFSDECSPLADKEQASFWRQNSNLKIESPSRQNSENQNSENYEEWTKIEIIREPVKSTTSSSLDSPAGSTQEMTHGRAGVVQPVTPSSVGSLTTLTSTTTLSGGDSSTPFHQQTYEDSDFDTEPDPPDWRLSISQDELAKLKPKEKKRQDVINEFFQTERSHVRNLKVLDRLFCRPLLEGNHMSKELIERLFPNLDDVLAVHTKYNQRMKERIKAGFPIGSIGEILSDMFEDSNGDTLIHVGSEFTKNQKFSIEELKDKRRKDHKLDLFLAEQERRPECRRLQLQSILPVEHQRLVKYPLLLEQLLKQCDKDADPDEYNIVKRCVDRTREILESIDRQVAEAQNIQRLAEIQTSLDTSGLEKNADNTCAEYKNLDLRKHRLIYDGPLTLKLGDTRRFKTVDLHVLLLEDCIMLLQKQDDKYQLKFHTSTASNSTVSGQGSSNKFCHSPVIKLSTMLVRPVATDKRAFYLLNTTEKGPQIYELVASSSADRTQWFRHITEASNAYKARENRRSYRGNDSPSHNGLGDSDRKSEGVSTESLDLPGDKKGQPAGRSQSFHEHSVSSLEPHPERQPSSPPEDRAEADSFASKTGGDESATSQRKRLQRVEILKIAEPCPLIDPSQVVVTQGEILVADPVLTPIEKIHRKDLEISRALQEKLNLIAEILHIPLVDFDNIVDMASQPAPDRDAREVLLAALAQAKSLTDLVNESLSLSEEATVIASTEPFRLSSPPKDVGAEPRSRLPGPPTERLVGISSSMNQHLTSLLAIIQERDDERDRLRRELQRSQEQVHALLSQSSVRTSSLSATSPTSRPASFISVEESSAADMSEKNQESEDDVTGGKSLEETDSSPPQDSTLTEDKDLDEERKVSAAGTDSDEQDQFVDAAEITQAKSETEATGDDDGEKEKEEN